MNWPELAMNWPELAGIGHELAMNKFTKVSSEPLSHAL